MSLTLAGALLGEEITMDTLANLFRSNKIEISGHVCTVHVIARFMSDEKNRGSSLFDSFSDSREKVINEIRKTVYSTIGPRFEVRELEIRPGSVELIVVITTVGTLYYGISRYKNFIESLDLLASQLRRIFVRLFNPTEVIVTAGWEPGTAFIHPSTSNQLATGSPALYGLLIGYLVVTNLVFIAFVLWQLVSKR
jgi:hypothetical protein